ncbi:hypothetical protein BCR35DRAFT_22950 [Leucosporidium creatinivorum]|uniref:Nudix hydrolase domain-containing protein n=1 Tax=Leucosporidium creatinivorum TaxID=106004 RepID=A0A1Y2FY41_9BASI|nr:hypothetical protein BCR35DRAFT_22950 [Leucosporidium creatinivorum]
MPPPTLFLSTCTRLKRPTTPLRLFTTCTYLQMSSRRAAPPPPHASAAAAATSSAAATTTARPRDAIRPGDPVSRPSPSASLVLLSPLSERTTDGFNYRVLLLKRNARSTTFFSAHVFPGGNLDPIDSDFSAWESFFPSGSKLGEEEGKMQSVKLCAARETFEECGILLLEGGNEGKGRQRWTEMKEEERKAWRDKVHDDGTQFVELFKLLGEGEGGQDKIRPGLSSLQFRANWITPANMKRRYDTSFFLTILPPSSTSSSTSSSAPTATHSDHIATADNGETISADWLTPHEAIRRTLLHTSSLQSSTPTPPPEGSIILFPPQFYLLAELAGTKNWEDVLDGKQLDVGGLPLARPRSITAFEPEIKGVVDASGAFRAATVLVGDPEHSKTDPAKAEEGDRHRTYVLLPAKPKTEDEKEKWRKNPPLGLTVMGVERRGMERLFGGGWEDMTVGDCGGENAEKARL